MEIISNEFLIVAGFGPRQVGKTTLEKMFFKGYSYVSFEDSDVREPAENNPRSFLIKYLKNIIYDEIKRVPDFISFLQTHVDSGKIPKK